MDWNKRIEDIEYGSHFKRECNNVDGECAIDDGVFVCEITNSDCVLTLIEEDSSFITLKYRVDGKKPPSLVGAETFLIENAFNSDYIIIEGQTEFSAGQKDARIEIPEDDVQMKKRNGHKVKPQELPQYDD